jgi:glycosyltransferase involved in cell wall biosynthesis/thioredoxin-like negative regulator of GroEL
MTVKRFLFFHKDHPLSVTGCNSGAENATLWLAKTLARLGHEVILAGIIPEGTHNSSGIRFVDIGINFDTSIAFKLLTEEQKNYHLISACRALPILESRNDSLCLSRGFIAHDPSSAATGIKPEILSEVCDYMICVSEAQKKLFIEAGANNEKIHVIPNGADLDLFKAAQPEDRNPNKLIFVGALVAHKGIDILLQAFYNISHKHPNAELHVLGSSKLWGQEPFINEQAIAAQIKNVKFHGAVNQEQVANEFRTAAACIIPSRWFDSFPLTAVESLVTGCPVIAFDVGGIKEAVINNINGIILPEVSEDLLTQKLDEVLSNREILRNLSINALEKSRPYFTWENTAQRLIELIDKSNTKQKFSYTEGKVGFITTWNQKCGLATYASFLVENLPKHSYFVLSEENRELTKNDENFVARCWSRDSDNYENLFNTISKLEIKILHINCHARFFHFPKFNEFLSRCKKNDVKIVATVHSLFSIEAENSALLPNLHQVYVHCIESKLEAVANGANPDSVLVIPHGVKISKKLTSSEKETIRQTINVSSDEKLITCFGFIQPHKGMEAMIDAVAALNHSGIKSKGLLCGGINRDDPNSEQYFNALVDYAKQLNLTDKVIFLNRYVSDEEVESFLSASDLIVMNYRSQYFEASGACSLAVGSGVPVVTSLAPAFTAFGDAVFKSTSGYPIDLISKSILSDKNLNNSIIQNASDYCEKNSWANISKQISDKYFNLGIKLSSKQVESMNTNKKIKVLLHNRPNTFTQRGGDTIVIEKLLDGLKNSNVEVTIDLEAKHNPKDFNLVHIFNFALPDMVRYYAEQSHKAGVPYVITTLLEDIPNFHYQSHFVSSQLIEYVSKNQNKDWFNSHSDFNYHLVEKAKPFDNAWAAKNASALFTNGLQESITVKKTYGDNLNIKEIKLGHELKAQGSKEEWIKEFGFEDFVLCVGRIESRKNQLALLKALEGDEITVVLAGGGFSYQPDYLEAVKNFKRKGKTIILSKLSDQQLANAYAAAKVHALPSWYELPGLVSLEAAHYGCNIVATRNGTSSDYLGDEAFYCDPGNLDSIRTAVLSAYYAPRQTNLKEKVMNYSWKQMADQTLLAYQDVAKVAVTSFTTETKVIEDSDSKISIEESDPIKFQECLERGELLASDRNFEEAIKSFEMAKNYGTATSRLLRAHAATLLASGDHNSAKPLFKNALDIDRSDSKSWCGLGMCFAFEQNFNEAYKCQLECLKIAPTNSVSIFQLMEASYRLEKYEDLEKILRNFNLINPNDIEMKFCLAGCLFKAGKIAEAESINSSILLENSNHTGALTLKDELKKNTSSIKIEVERAAQSRSDLSSSAENFMPLDQEILDTEEVKRKGNYEEALSRVAKLFSEGRLSNSQKEVVKCLKAEVLVLTDRFVEADNIYSEVLAENSNCARALCGKGALAAAAGDWQEAKKYFENALNLRSEYDVALAGLGLCASQQNQAEIAWNFYTRALKSNGENTRALFGIIETGYQLKRLSQVEESLKNYLESHPADLNFMYSLAGCCFAQGKAEEAIQAINTITLFEPNHKNALELRSMIDKQLQSAHSA